MMLGGSIRLNPLACILFILFLIALSFFLLSPFTQKSESGRNDEVLISLKELLSVSIDAARRGGQLVKEIRLDANDNIGQTSKGKTEEGANNPVTNGDILSHLAMFHSLITAFPRLHVISEEMDPSNKRDDVDVSMPDFHNPQVESIVVEDTIVSIKDVTVWIDPLDATQEYTENLLEYVTTMVCVAVNGVPIIGVVYKPFSDTEAWAWASGTNTYVNKVLSDDFSKSEKAPSLSSSRFIVSRSHAGNVKNLTSKAFGDSIKVTPAGGAGFKVWEVVKGTQDAYVHMTLIKKWDICPGNAILKAFGGKLTTLDGSLIDYSGLPEANRGGVLATVHDHDFYVQRFKDFPVTNGGKKNQ